jgi:diaminopimelate epimerase
MKNISFVKMTGAGNDFIVIDKDENPGIVLNENVISKLCNRRFGLGGDGLITVANSAEFDFDMMYFNADGSTGSLCGNGARCAIKFAEISGRLKNGKAKFRSNSASYSGELLNGEKIKFNLNSPEKLKLDFPVNAGGQRINASFADTGSPHVVIKIEDVLKDPADASSSYKDIEEFPVFTLGRELRYHDDFNPGGTNVNFISMKEGKVLIRTYERGVEDETLACGTGSVAAALIASLKEKLNPPVKLITRGGDELSVDFKMNADLINEISLTGPALAVFSGRFDLNKFL